MFNRAALVSLAFGAVALGQLVGTYQTETHPKLTYQKCTKSGGCTTVSNGQVVLDSNWRWIHVKDGYTNCYTGNAWNTTVCANPKTCASNCALDGADYSKTYGITTSGNALTLKFVTTNDNGKNIGSRVYLMSSDTQYEMVKLLNQEFTFDVDVSKLPCGLNGALYFSEMEADGGLKKYTTNKAGAKYGTGYCDSQCPKDIKWINGEANSDGWSAGDDPNGGTGKYGTCCNEMDIWEANKVSAAYTPHPCKVSGQYRCEGAECNTPTDRYAGVCDPDGCDFNSYRMGDTSFYGPGKTVDTNKKFTVITQFISSDGTANGKLKEIRRLYVQDGKVINNSKVKIPGISSSFDSVTEEFCTAQKTVFNDRNRFQEQGGIDGMASGINKNGMVLALSIWDDHVASMLWLDSTYPVDSTNLGAARGDCPTSSGKPTDVESASPDAQVIYSNIKFGDIGSTFTGATTTSSSTTTTTTTSTAPGPTQTKFGQCGGNGWTGPTQCAAGSTCKVQNQWFSQCM